MAKNKVTEDFLNPFDAGVNYKDFLASIPEGKTVEQHCKGKITDEQLEFLLQDLKHYSNNNK
jgi:hypothetical protein